MAKYLWNKVRSHFFAKKYNALNKAVMSEQHIGEEDETNRRPVKYYSDRDRIENQLIIKDGIFYQADEVTLYQSGSDERSGRYASASLYAIQNEVLCVAKKVISSTEKINHSSIFAGEPVDCAGSLEINSGVLKHINNCSGHYNAPPAEALFKVISFLRKNKIDLESYSVALHDPKTLKPTLWKTALDFLENYPMPPSKTQKDRASLEEKIELPSYRFKI